MCSSHTAKELNLKFNQLYRRQCNLYHTYAAACHLSDTAFSILYCLCETEADEHTTPFTQHELAELCSLPRQTSCQIGKNKDQNQMEPFFYKSTHRKTPDKRDWCMYIPKWLRICYTSD